jgi:hypothetical protein
MSLFEKSQVRSGKFRNDILIKNSKGTTYKDIQKNASKKTLPEKSVSVKVKNEHSNPLSLSNRHFVSKAFSFFPGLRHGDCRCDIRSKQGVRIRRRRG